ncbi:MAG TPA: low temperature requirement protein A [Nocardioidaceae bacterium]|nr:low temperature requirement protein A [Nocardioidaceae bacterium]
MSELSRLFHPLTARDRDEPHRTATPLELFTDLCVVVAVAQAAESLHHAIVEDHVADGLAHFALMFFAIYWAWLNFTWFASAYDNDDVGYRLLTLLQVVGVLILAAGIPRAFDDDFVWVVIGYIVMRIALVIQWIRVARADPLYRQTALRYAVGITVVQIGWTLMLAAPEAWFPPIIIVLVAGEMLTPAWAEAARRTQWHPRHIAERYGLFTIIVLGESILAATVAIQVALDEHTSFADLAAIIAGGVLTVFSMWWLYFAKDAHRVLVDNRVGFRFGYIHYLIFGAGAAVGAGLVVQIDQATGHSEIGDKTAAAALTIPVVLYLAATWFGHLALHEGSAGHGRIVVAASILILLATFTPEPALITGLVSAVMLATLITIASRSETADQP